MGGSMKIALLFFFAFVFSCSLFAQPVFKKQISFLDFDARNPSFIEAGDFGYSSYWFGSLNALLFEGYNDPLKPQIFALKYSAENDSFYAPTQITFSKGSCINPCGIKAQVGNLVDRDKIIWQTNENGNWDICYGELFGDSLRNIRFIAKDSLSDETNPRLLFHGRSGYGFDFAISYQKGGSIYLYFEVDTLKVTEKIFDAEGVDSFEYQNASGELVMEFQNKDYYGTIVAEKKIQNGEIKAVYKTRDYNLKSWGAEKYLYDSVSAIVNPLLIDGGGEFVSFEIEKAGKRQLKFFNYSLYFGNPEFAQNISDSTYETFNFSFKSMILVGKTFSKSFYGYGQSIYQIKREGKNYLRPFYFCEFTYPHKDSLIGLKLGEPKITTANVGIYYDFLRAYSVWEDSSDNGRIQLFCSSGHYPVGGIENETSPKDFTLNQNYPNPFNPETVIGFHLSSKSNVSLRIFDVLGREVATLVNEEKLAGEYQVLFNNQLSTNYKPLSSGVYFYQLKVGNRLQTRKMLLLK